MADKTGTAATVESTVETALETFIERSRRVLAVPGAKPEVSLYSQLEDFLEAVLPAVQGSTRAADRLEFIQQVDADEKGVPDFRVHRGGGLLGWIEFKAVKDKDLNHLVGHDRDQVQRFTAGLQNLIVTNGWQWKLFQHGRQVGPDVVLGPSTLFDPVAIPFAVSAGRVAELVELLRQFLAAKQTPFSSPKDAVAVLADRARALKLALVEVGRDGAGDHLQQLESDFRAMLFKNGAPFTWEKFVDSYVQIATFGLLLWRLETGRDIHLGAQVGLRAGVHPLLHQCLSIMWMPQSRIPILEPILEEVCRTVNLVDPALFAPAPGPSGDGRYVPDPIVHAYEPFFTSYDRAERDANGVYYTPVEIVQHIVSGVAHLLRTTLGRPEGLLDEDAQFLDPATGTGTFLLGLANAIAAEAAAVGLPPDQMVSQVLTRQVSAFELFPGPYTLAHQRLESTLRGIGAPPTERLPIYLADTLAAPVSGTLGGSRFGVVGSEIQHERERADRVKTAERILVILGNPPYERVLESQGGGFEPFARGLLDLLRDATPAAQRANLKSTKDLFVAFWMWALWALQSPEARRASSAMPALDPSDCHGIVAFITNRSWIGKPSLTGLRSLVRAGASEVWVLDLGGDSRGAHGARSFAGGDANVFGIRTGVAIVWAVFNRHDTTGSCTVRYRRLLGTKAAKLRALREEFDADLFAEVSGRGGATFLPDGWKGSSLAAEPRLDELFRDEPMTGIQSARDTSEYSPVHVDKDEVYAEIADRRRGQSGVVRRMLGNLGRWAGLSEAERAKKWATADSKRRKRKAPSPNDLAVSKLREVLYRPLDVRWLYDDPAWIDWYREDLHAIYSNGRRVPSLVTIASDHGRGPAVIHADMLMDQHSFNNRGNKGVYSLWRPFQEGQIAPEGGVVNGLRTGLSDTTLRWLESIGRAAQFEDAYDYILAVLSAPKYTETYWLALESDFLRVPLTDDGAVFDEAAELGRRLRAAWSLSAPLDPAVGWTGEPSQEPLGQAARVAGDRVRFANGRELTGVTSDVWKFEVSNYPVVQRWFEARKHWTVTPKRAREAQAMLSSVRAMLDLGPQLNDLLKRLVH